MVLPRLGRPADRALAQGDGVPAGDLALRGLDLEGVGLLAEHEEVEDLGPDEVDHDLLDDPDHLLVVEGGVELVGSHVQVRQVVVLLLDLDVAVGELLVLLLDLAVPCLQLGQPPLQLPDPARQLAHAVVGGARGARGAGGAFEGRHLEAEALVLPHEFLSELLGLEEHLEEFLALLDGIFRLVHGPASAEILSYSRPWSVCTLRWRKAFSRAIPA